MSTPSLKLDYMSDNQTAAYSLFNADMNALDARVCASVINRTTTSPPGSPADGDSYIPATGASGAWATKDNQIATYYGGQWNFFAPGKAGFVVYDQAVDGFVAWDGSGWGGFNGLTQAPDITASSGTVTIDYRLGNSLKITANGNITIAFSNFPAGPAMVSIEARQFGSHTITFPGSARFAGGSPPAWTAGGRDLFDVFKTPGGDYYIRNVSLNM